MHLLLLVLRLLLNLFVPAGRDGLSLAARTDGRVEQVPADRALRDGWAGRQSATARRAERALAVRAKGKASSSTDTPPQ